jgi:hypothetical protein
LVAVDDLVNQAIQGASTVGEHLDELREVFRPHAYAGIPSNVLPLAKAKNVPPEKAAWSLTIKAMLRSRAKKAQNHIAQIEKNIRTFEDLGMWALMFTLGEDTLAQEIVRRATGCKLLLQPVKRRVRLYSAMPLFVWRVMGSKMAHTWVYGGAQLIQEYEGLTNAVLIFVRARGEDSQHEPLLAVL